MYKVLSGIVQLGRYSHFKKKHHFFSKSFVLQGYHFCNHVIKSILSEAKLQADQDGTWYNSIG